jgi:hypothetical protein
MGREAVIVAESHGTLPPAHGPWPGAVAWHNAAVPDPIRRARAALT